MNALFNALYFFRKVRAL